MDAQAALSKPVVLLSVISGYARKIIEGSKTVELRRRFPIHAADSDVLIYSSKIDKAIIGVAKIVEVADLPIAEIWDSYEQNVEIARGDFLTYFLGRSRGFAIQLGGASAFSRPLKIDELKSRWSIVVPQSYRYVSPDMFHEICAAGNEHPHRY